MSLHNIERDILGWVVEKDVKSRQVFGFEFNTLVHVRTRVPCLIPICFHNFNSNDFFTQSFFLLIKGNKTTKNVELKITKDMVDLSFQWQAQKEASQEGSKKKDEMIYLRYEHFNQHRVAKILSFSLFSRERMRNEQWLMWYRSARGQDRECRWSKIFLMHFT